ncbi:hypothetical protein BASA50_009333 [Batrachochytrium salamandrivorans]|uniref:UBC core domain-containing protein n=1 Tax=Batrachochytrium salamandrivorans TaxID=1357716 RepID=A0ABQ8F4I8_9FUNG|nr:hypothetical protein BASA60_008460 [Batrachochytrium salamandrivorans]KAH6570761.1 hypothetical protein BASA62_004176 [Batrachochytrium salamandrivorans]KAH6586593.1 hypothetical protein BASA61_006509 [Batrachochytrium salamandrivorans]KAH6590358.1 hypothetical protein BASA50_009333 [Batrachochytrium salamandrivorans]KAH9255000.1 hypothetical protein BASA81_006945 [Batrachochytrium salamandrivorans]
MATRGAFKRLTKEAMLLQASPTPFIIAKPLDTNILEWHYVLTGPPGSHFEGGTHLAWLLFYYGPDLMSAGLRHYFIDIICWIFVVGQYHGKLNFPSDYPYKPPSIKMMTPNGRFQTDFRLCLTMSDYHPGSWNPAWSVSTILTGLLSFMLEEHTTTGSISTTSMEKRSLAGKSKKWNLSSPKFREVFPEICKEMEQSMEMAAKATAAGVGSTSSKSSGSATSVRLSAPACQLAQRRNVSGTTSNGGSTATVVGSDTEPAVPKQATSPWPIRSHAVMAIVACLALYLLTIKIFSRSH